MTSAMVIAVCAVACIGYVNADHCCLTPTPESCEDIQDAICQSGHYVIGAGEYRYCSAEEICGSKGWTRVGAADFECDQESCPSGFVLHDADGVRGCKIESLDLNSASIAIPTSMSYSQVCGRVKAYAFGSPDAFASGVTGPDDIEQNYIDGVSITRGASNARQHVFTLAAAYREESDQCPCSSTGNGAATPPFVGADYYCESGNPTGSWSPIVYADDLLWDGEQCGGFEGPCCSTSNNIPYFYKNIGTSTSDALELRAIVDQDLATDENIILLSYEIFVK